jgi:HEAT repeat protein
VRRPRILFVAALVVVCGLAAFRTWDRQPAFEGKKLSDWLIQYENSQDDNDERAAAEAAVRRLGTNALPYLVKWLRYEPSQSQRKLAGALSRLPQRFQSDSLREWLLGREPETRAEAAVAGFSILGPAAAPAASRLDKLIGDKSLPASSARALRALVCIGPACLPHLMAALADPATPNRFAMAGTIALANLGTNARPALPLLIQCTKDADTRAAEGSVLALGVLKLEPDLTVPTLLNSLADQRQSIRIAAVWALSHFSTEPRVPPALQGAAQDSDRKVREAAAAALEQLAGAAQERPNRALEATRPDSAQ